jgi:hypothetical protein
MLVTLIAIGICFFLYFLPGILGWHKRDMGAIFAVNLFLGWTLVGWVVALAWALKGEQPTQVVVQLVTPAPALFCSTCGRYSPAGSKFCANCGSQLEKLASLKSLPVAR